MMSTSRPFLVTAALAAACSDGRSSLGGAPDASMASLLSRGEYIAQYVALCSDCHTPRNADGSFDGTKLLSGVECFFDLDPEPGKGCLHTRNLTPDATGLKNVSDAQLKDMILNGVTPTGKALNPFMPSYVYHNMTDADANALVAFLRSVPAVAHAVPASEPPWEAPPTPTPPIDPATIPPAPPGNESAARGRYLAAMAGLCIECHTPVLPPGGIRPIDMSKPFAGGRDFQPLFPSPPFPPHIYARNLTQDATGLAGWTAADVVKVVRHGIDRNGQGICPPMPSGPAGPFAGLTDDDVADIASYLLTLPAIHNEIPSECVAP